MLIGLVFHHSVPSSTGLTGKLTGCHACGCPLTCTSQLNIVWILDNRFAWIPSFTHSTRLIGSLRTSSSSAQKRRSCFRSPPAITMSCSTESDSCAPKSIGQSSVMMRRLHVPTSFQLVRYVALSILSKFTAPLRRRDLQPYRLDDVRLSPRDSLGMLECCSSKCFAYVMRFAFPWSDPLHVLGT